MSVYLAINGCCLIQSPSSFLRYSGFMFSCLCSVAFIGVGIVISQQAVNIKSNMELFCKGGFPNFALITEIYVSSFVEVEQRYILKHMCKDYCACSTKIIPDKFGSRAKELEGMDLKTGAASTFYDHCYKVGVDKQDINPLKQGFLDLIKEMEANNDCQGICNTNLFYFFKSSSNGPPPKSCFEPIVTYFITEWGQLGFWCLVQGANLLIYCLLQFRMWNSFSR